MDPDQARIEELERIVGELVSRVWRLERELASSSGSQTASLSSQRAQTTSSQGASQAGSTQRVNLRSPAPDLESRIGAEWLSRVGIIAVLIGVSFFLKYAFEGGWIGPAQRVWIGLFAGVALVIWSEWFRIRNYRFFSFSLKALGLGILYLSLWAAFQVYELISWALAFAAMIVVTVSTAVLALWQDAEILALFALVGGFITPVLLYTGQNRALQLFAIEFSSYWISIVWFLEAAALMTVGFWKRSAFVRWQALALIALTIAKVFALDIWRLHREYRIVSFVLLGVLLLAVSFLYQRDWLKLSARRES